MARESKTGTVCGPSSAPSAPGSSCESRGCLPAAASFTFLHGFLPSCRVGGQIEGDRGPGQAGSDLDVAGKAAADGARDVQSPWCSVSAQDISEQQPLPTEPAACSITAFHAVHLTLFPALSSPREHPLLWAGTLSI